MDFIDGLSFSNGKSTIFVVVNKLSKYAHFIAIAHPYIGKLSKKKKILIIYLSCMGCPNQLYVTEIPRSQACFGKSCFNSTGLLLTSVIVIIRKLMAGLKL